MQPSRRICVALLACFSAFAYAGQAAPQGAAPPQVPPAPGGNGVVLSQRPAPQAENANPAGAGISLDVVVADKSGKPVPGLTLSDFTLLDNKQPSKILSFRSSDGTAQPADPLVQVILLFDTVNTDFDAVSFARQQTENFLRQNGGHLAVPVSIYWLTNEGINQQQELSTDGNALAAQLDAATSRLRTINRAAGAYGAIERFELSTRMLDTLAQNELHVPGRKLLIWAGPGWPMLDNPEIDVSSKGQQALFSEIVRMSALMREAHIELDSISQGMPGPDTYLYQSFVKGVKKLQQAGASNLSLKVLAVQSGGLVLSPTNDLSSSIARCMQDAGPFYTLSFAPPPADGPNEYHELQVRIGRPGLTAHTNTGYYNQPQRPPAP
ncbi:MAG: VWA domain-containing protein [Terracidiphilus sp.]